jgi:lysophospholipase L1-like esterase
MKNKLDQVKKALVVLIFFLFVLKSFSQTPIEFKDGDKICFIGNSITHDGSYHTFLQVYCATQQPDIKLEFINCGVSGDKATGILQRFEEDILIHQPDYAFLMTGMNDVARSLYGIENPDPTILAKRNEALETYYENTTKIAELLIENNIKPIFIAPSPYDQTAKLERKNLFGTNDALGLCAKHIKKLARKHNAHVVNFYDLLNKINIEGQRKDPSYTIIGKDRVHPDENGHLLMGFEIVKTLFPVSDNLISIDAKSLKVETSQNQVKNIDFKTELQFDLKLKSIPYALADSLQQMRKLIPHFDDYTRQELAVKGLKKGNYILLIDNVEVTKVTAKELAGGINLFAYKNSPFWQHGEKIYELCFDCRRVQRKLRNLYLVEFSSLKDYKGDGSLSDKEDYLEKRNEAVTGKPWHSYYINLHKEYIENLSKKDVLEQEFIEKRNAIYSENKPKWVAIKLISSN